MVKVARRILALDEAGDEYCQQVLAAWRALQGLSALLIGKFRLQGARPRSMRCCHRGLPRRSRNIKRAAN